MITGNGISEVFTTLCDMLKQAGSFREVGGVKTLELLCPQFTLLRPRDRLLNTSIKSTCMSYAIGEILWYLSCDNSLERISYYSKFWDSISDDGKTVNSAYGYIFDKHYGNYGNQIDYVVKELRHDINSRRAVISIYQPPLSLDSKDVPCTIGLHFYVDGDRRLCLHTMMRSNDIILGLPNDVFCFTFLQEIVAYILDLELGTYTHTATSLHIYERHFELLSEVNREKARPSIQLYMPYVDEAFADELDEIKEYEVAYRKGEGMVDDSNIKSKLGIFMLNELKAYSKVKHGNMV